MRTKPYSQGEFTIIHTSQRIAKAVGLVVAILLAAGCSQAPGFSTPPPAATQAPPTRTPLLPASPTGLPTTTPVPQPSPTVQPACQDTQGSVESSQIDSNLLRHPFEFRIYLPPCYLQNTDQHYPVLYLLHGQGSTDQQWLDLGLAEDMDELIVSKQITPFLVVLPYDPSTALPDQDPFGDALVKELVPWIDAHYAALPARAYRAIGGLSRGASWAVRLGLTHWELFGAIGGHSLPVFWSDGPLIPGWLDAIPYDQYPRIYLDIGVNDGLFHPASAFEELLDERDIPHEWYVFQGTHVEDYWRSHLEQYLRWYAEEW
jgi:enterochelin esterase-like enzyme